MSKLAPYRRPVARSYANPRKEKEQSTLAYARRRTRLFLFRQFAQHAQRLEYGLSTYLGAADVAISPIMRNHPAAARGRAEINQANRLAGYGAGWPRNPRNRH